MRRSPISFSPGREMIAILGFRLGGRSMRPDPSSIGFALGINWSALMARRRPCTNSLRLALPSSVCVSTKTPAVFVCDVFVLSVLLVGGDYQETLCVGAGDSTRLHNHDIPLWGDRSSGDGSGLRGDGAQNPEARRSWTVSPRPAPRSAP